MNHTPGPWTVKLTGTIAQQSSGDVIATCGFKVAVGSDEDDANARLIAAAPDLLAALSELETHLSHIGMTREEEPFLEAARRAIAKAVQL